MKKIHNFFTMEHPKAMYCVSNRSWPILHSNLLYKIGQNFFSISLYYILGQFNLNLVKRINKEYKNIILKNTSIFLGYYFVFVL